MSMDVDEEELGERGMKFETLFAKSDELQVVFYAHLPEEVKVVLKNAGTLSIVCFCTYSAHCLADRPPLRLLQRCVQWRGRHRHWLRDHLV